MRELSANHFSFLPYTAISATYEQFTRQKNQSFFCFLFKAFEEKRLFGVIEALGGRV
jgi:hypothetical protein